MYALHHTCSHHMNMSNWDISLFMLFLLWTTSNKTELKPWQNIYKASTYVLWTGGGKSAALNTQKKLPATINLEIWMWIRCELPEPVERGNSIYAPCSKSIIGTYHHTLYPLSREIKVLWKMVLPSWRIFLIYSNFVSSNSVAKTSLIQSLSNVKKYIWYYVSPTCYRINLIYRNMRV